MSDSYDRLKAQRDEMLTKQYGPIQKLICVLVDEFGVDSDDCRDGCVYAGKAHEDHPLTFRLIRDARAALDRLLPRDFKERLNGLHAEAP